MNDICSFNNDCLSKIFVLHRSLFMSIYYWNCINTINPILDLFFIQKVWILIYSPNFRMIILLSLIYGTDLWNNMESVYPLLVEVLRYLSRWLPLLLLLLVGLLSTTNYWHYRLQNPWLNGDSPIVRSLPGDWLLWHRSPQNRVTVRTTDISMHFAKQLK